MLISFQIFIWLLAVTFAYRLREELMSFDDIKNIFGNREGRIPDYALIELLLPTRAKRGLPGQFAISLDFYGQYNLSVNVHKITDNYLVGPHTGIWYSEYKQKAHRNVMNSPLPSTLSDLGNFELYQDSGTDSAITVFNHLDGSKRLSGIIHGWYGIKNLEYQYVKRLVSGSLWMRSHAIKMRSLNPHSNTSTDPNEENSYVCIVYKFTEESNEDLINKIRESKRYHRQTKRQATGPTPLVVYPKILLTMDLQSRHTHYSQDLVYLISYWNVVDMIYRVFANPEIRLCITNIIIPLESKATPYIAKDTRKISEISAYDTSIYLRMYFDDEKIRFPLENYNIVVFMTMKYICADQTGPQCKTLAGASSARKLCEVSPKTEMETTVIVAYDWSYGVISTVAHELGHVFGVSDHDGEASALSCSKVTGNIMTPSTRFSTNLRWSSCSSQAISTYLGSAKRSCLRTPPSKVPWSLRNMPGAWLSLSGQCLNNDQLYKVPCQLPNQTEICVEFGCGFAHQCLSAFDSPLDGTACKLWNNQIGYCMAGKCNMLQP